MLYVGITIYVYDIFSILTVYEEHAILTDPKKVL